MSSKDAPHNKEPSAPPELLGVFEKVFRIIETLSVEVVTEKDRSFHIQRELVRRGLLDEEFILDLDKKMKEKRENDLKELRGDNE